MAHGDPRDRGAADSYYGRSYSPHKYLHGTYNGERIVDLTPEEIESYKAGYEENEALCNHKDWGHDFDDFDTQEQCEEFYDEEDV